jgi:hypothetical protein
MPRTKMKTATVREAHVAEKKDGKKSIPSLRGGRVQSRRQRARGLRNWIPKERRDGSRRVGKLGRRCPRSDT